MNDAGDLMHLDAGLTTRKLKVHRVPEIDINVIGEGFDRNDKSGNPFGELSGAETTEFSFNDTDFKVEYGSPLKRGRDFLVVLYHGENVGELVRIEQLIFIPHQI